MTILSPSILLELFLSVCGRPEPCIQSAKKDSDTLLLRFLAALGDKTVRRAFRQLYGAQYAAPIRMARRRLIRSTEHPYHVTGRANNREPFKAELSEVWRTLSYACFEASVVHGARVHALVLMPNHFHMLVSTPKSDLGEVMAQFMVTSTRRLNQLSGRTGRVFGARYHGSLIDSAPYCLQALKYVYRNPVKAGLCDQVETWRWSSLSRLLGEGELSFPLHPLIHGVGVEPGQLDTLLRWLNQPSPSEQEQRVQKALRSPRFRMPLERSVSSNM